MIDQATNDSNEPLRRGDYLILLVCCCILYLLALLPGRVLSGHAAVIPQTAKEMLATHDWFIPRAGGQPWIERPPLSAWVIAGVNTIFRTSQSDRVVRFAAVLVAIPTLVLVAWIASVFFGRTIALLSALILATCWEFHSFAIDPEADIFLCLVVTAVMAMFVRLEFGARTAAKQSPRTMESRAFFGRRSWLVLALFIVLGLTNLAKGLLFGTLVAVIPVGGYLLLSGDRSAIRRYVWFWGWLVLLAVSLAWPVYVALHYPEALAFWDAHYFGRLYRGYLAEPFWYYGPATLGNLLPWTPAALFGLWITRREALHRPRSPQRFLWAWAILPPLLFSIPDGKHHHYMLHSMAPLAILAAIGTVRLWQRLLCRPAWVRHPAWGLLVVGLPAVVAIAAASDKLRGPSWIAPVLAASAMVLISLASFFMTRPDGRWAMGGTFVVLTLALTLALQYQATYIDDYHDDIAFLNEARRIVPDDCLLLGQWDPAGLESFWLMFYGDARMKMVHTTEDISDALGDRREAYILARRENEPAYSAIGRTEEVLASGHTRSEKFPSLRRRVLYHLTRE